MLGHCVCAQTNTQIILKYAKSLTNRVFYDKIEQNKSGGDDMKTVTIYRINETDRTIDIAQSVNDDSESIKAAVLNTKNFTFDEILRQHLAFRGSGTLIENCLNRFLSALHIGRSIPVNADDMLAGFTAENGENIFLRGMMTAAHELYDVERTALSAPNDVLLATLNKSRIQAEISAKINTFFDSKLAAIGDAAYFDCGQKLNAFAVLHSEIIIFSDDYTFSTFRICDNCLTNLLFELGQIVHRNAMNPRKCGFCGKMFLGTEDEVCCRQSSCQTAHKEQKEAIYKEHTEEYSQIKRTYDAFVRRYDGYLKAAGINARFPAEYDEFCQAKEVRKSEMNSLKKRLIRNGLPTDELYEMGEKFKAEIRAIAERIMEKCGR